MRVVSDLITLALPITFEAADYSFLFQPCVSPSFPLIIMATESQSSLPTPAHFLYLLIWSVKEFGPYVSFSPSDYIQSQNDPSSSVGLNTNIC